MKIESVKVSIIMPVFNSEKYLTNAVRSILDQNFDSFELILVDDGSTDRSGNICDEFAQTDTKVKVIHKENGGICSARNVGLKISQGEYVGFCDNDDKFLPNLLKDNYELARQYDADIVRFNRKRIIQGIGGRRETEVNFMPSGIHFFQGKDIDKNYLGIRKCSVAVWSALYKSDFLLKHCLHFPERAKSGLEDRIFNIKAYQYCERIVLNSKIYYIWNRREEHSTSDKFDLNIIHTMYDCIKVEHETYRKRQIEKYARNYWNNIILFYLYFCFWNLNRKCCNLGLLRKIGILIQMRNNQYLTINLNGNSYKSIDDTNVLGKKIFNCFYKKHYLMLYLLLKIRNKEY